MPEQPEIVWKVLGAVATGAALAKVAEAVAPIVARQPAVIEGRKRADRAVHVLRGRPIAYRLRVEDGTVHIEDDHARIDTVTVIGGPPRVAMTEVEAILTDALERARGAVHQAPAFYVGPVYRPAPTTGREADDA